MSASIYFCSFHLLSVLFMMSLLMGLLWETFYVVDKAFNTEDELEDEQDDHGHHDEHSHPPISDNEIDLPVLK